MRRGYQVIVDAIASAITSLLNVIFSALPSFSITSALGLPSAGGHSTDAPGTVAGKYMGWLDTYLPVHETALMIEVALAAILAFYATYKLANWVYRHFP